MGFSNLNFKVSAPCAVNKDEYLLGAVCTKNRCCKDLPVLIVGVHMQNRRRTLYAAHCACSGCCTGLFKTAGEALQAFEEMQKAVSA